LENKKGNLSYFEKKNAMLCDTEFISDGSMTRVYFFF